MRAVLPALLAMSLLCADVRVAGQREVPLTAGALAIAASRPPADFATTLLRALTNGQPGVRFTAARIVAVNRVQALEADVIRALEVESDTLVAAEQVRVLHVLNSPAAQPAIEAYLRRGGSLPRQPPQTPKPDAVPSDSKAALFAAIKRDSGPTLRTPPTLYPGLLASLLDAARCRQTDSPAFAAVELTYRADGRPSGAALDPGASSECKRALSGLVQLILADDSYRITEGTNEWLLLPLSRSAVTCHDLPQSDESLTIDGKTIQPPSRTKYVPPIYPAQAKAERRGGVVMIEGVMTSTGCLRQLSVVRGVTHSINFSAVQAASQWQYAPAQVEGRPIPVLMTLTINFTVD